MKLPKIGWFTPQAAEIKRTIASQPGMSPEEKRETAQRIIEDEEIDSLLFNAWKNTGQRFLWTMVGFLLFGLFVYA